MCFSLAMSSQGEFRESDDDQRASVSFYLLSMVATDVRTAKYFGSDEPSSCINYAYGIV